MLVGFCSRGFISFSRTSIIGYSINDFGLFRNFYGLFDLRTIKKGMYTIEITPYELATNLGLTVADRIIDKFEKKYKKYKIKYLNLVSKLQNIESN